MSNLKQPLNEEEVPTDGAKLSDAFGLHTSFKFESIFHNNYNSSDRKSEKLYLENCKNCDELARKFKTSLERGLDPNNKSDLEWRDKLWGNNKNKPPKPNSIWMHIIECLSDKILIILLVAAFVSLIIGMLKEGVKTGWLEGAAIFMAVFIVTGISSYMNWKQVEEFNELDQKNKIKEAIVIRNGEEYKLTNEDVLVGDVMRIKYGNIAVVDGVVIEGKLVMDESPVTGESDPMKKENSFIFQGDKYLATPFILSGSQCKEGDAKVLVVAVGRNTFGGRNEELRDVKAGGGEDEEGEEGEDIDQTPLQKHLADLADKIGDFGFIMAVLIGVVMIIKEAAVTIYNKDPLFTKDTINVFVNAFIIAVTVIVVAIPEGLPMAVTISLTYSVGKMKAENNLVKDIKKSETMGTVTNVCTDKTGTLTKGEMDLVSFYLHGEDFQLYGENKKDLLNDAVIKELIYNCIYKNITAKETFDRETQKNVLVGDMTECSLYKYLKDNGFNVKMDKKPDYTLAFKSDYKYMMNIYKEDDGYTLYIKGAPENTGKLCGKYRLNNSNEDSYESHIQEIQKMQDEYASRAIRTLLFGYKKIKEADIQEAHAKYPEEDLDFFNELAQGFTFAFMTGIRDNYRPDVPESIKKCARAGITVRMVTGDNISTAIAISKDVGIISKERAEGAKLTNDEIKDMIKDCSEDEVGQFLSNMEQREDVFALEGEVFRKISGNLSKKYDKETKQLEVSLKNPKMFKETVKKLRIIARASPEDKFLLVFGLKVLKNIVAVTGDGTNDAPALSQAHVGFSMGIRGTEVAKAAADIILLDDSFSSIVTACKYGRNVYDCIRKFVQFQLTVNVVAVFMVRLIIY